MGKNIDTELPVDLLLKETEVQYGNVLLEKSVNFSVRIIKFYRIKYKIIPVSILDQILRSGTSIGANISEAQSAYTKKDFLSKLSISLK